MRTRFPMWTFTHQLLWRRHFDDDDIWGFSFVELSRRGLSLCTVYDTIKFTRGWKQQVRSVGAIFKTTAELLYFNRGCSFQTHSLIHVLYVQCSSHFLCVFVKYSTHDALLVTHNDKVCVLISMCNCRTSLYPPCCCDVFPRKKKKGCTRQHLRQSLEDWLETLCQKWSKSHTLCSHFISASVTQHKQKDLRLLSKPRRKHWTSEGLSNLIEVIWYWTLRNTKNGLWA